MNRLEDENRWALSDFDAVREWAVMRRCAGIGVAVDPLGEYARNDEQACENAANYLKALHFIKGNSLEASLAIKLSALGLTFARPVAEKHLTTILQTASEAGVTVEIDIEGTPSVQPVCEMAQQAARDSFKTVLALQAYLDRTVSDVQQALAAGLKVRLVKGAYRGDTDDFHQIQQRFLAIYDQLLSSGKPFDVGTHDPLLLKAMTARLGTHNRDSVCFGFLKGLADLTKVQLAETGYLVAEYVPFGSNRSAYVTRRHAYLQRLGALGLEPCP